MKIILADTLYRPKLEGLLREKLSNLELVLVSPSGEVSGSPEGAEIFFSWGLKGSVVEAVVKQAKDLRWFHLMSAGVDSLMFPAMVESGIILTNARGIFAVPISEAVLAVMLLAAKNLRQNLENAAKAHWERLPREELYGKTAGILGYGSIGSATGERLSALGMRVIGLKRRVEQPVNGAAERIFSPHELHDFLEASDWVIICAALTSETAYMLGEEQFRRMKPTAWLVNIARGAIVDEKALLRALDEGWIAGACLDAFSQEPLPPDSPFWHHNKVIVTPHNAGASHETIRRNLNLVMENLDLYLKGEPLRNVVNKQLGY